MKNNIVLKIISTMIVACLLLLGVFSMTGSMISSGNGYEVLLRFVFSSCLVIIALVIIFGFAILKGIEDSKK